MYVTIIEKCLETLEESESQQEVKCPNCGSDYVNVINDILCGEPWEKVVELTCICHHCDFEFSVFDNEIIYK